MLHCCSCIVKRKNRPDQLGSKRNYTKLDVAVVLPKNVASHSISTKLRLEIQKKKGVQ